MTYNAFLINMAVATARGEKAMMRRMSRRASVRRSMRAVNRAKAQQRQGEDA